MFGLLVILSAGYLLIDFATWQAVGNATGSNILAFGIAATAGFITIPLQAAILCAAYERLHATKERSPG